MARGMEQTFLIIKPDGVERRLVGAILSRFEAKGLSLVAMRLTRITRTQARRHYTEHKGKPFFAGLVDFITSGPVVLLAVEGVDAVAVCRTLVGTTCGREAAPGTIRGDYGMSHRCNLIHASDCPRAARREIRHWFDRSDLIRPAAGHTAAIYDQSGPAPV